MSFAYAGPSDHDLDSVFVDAESLGQSVNAQLVASGLVYPTYYSKLFPDLRDALTAAADQARADDRGGGQRMPPPAGRPSPACRSWMTSW
jgi:hypothetical protein